MKEDFPIWKLWLILEQFCKLYSLFLLDVEFQTTGRSPTCVELPRFLIHRRNRNEMLKSSWEGFMRHTGLAIRFTY